jgi:hypothetical protein
MELEVDVAGLRLSVASDSAADLELIRRVVGHGAATGPPEAFLVVGDVGPGVPQRDPDFEGPYGQHWDDGVTHWFRHHWGLTAKVSPPHAEIGGPVAGHQRWVMVRNSMLFVLARLFFVQERFLLHGGALRRDNGAVLVVGPSGTGKSSLAFAAHLAGWQVGGDDMVVVDPHDSRVLVQGVPRVPTLPGDVASAVEGQALPRDSRDRLELTWLELDTRPAPIEAVVICAHDSGGGGLAPVSSAAALEALVPALVLSALPQPVTRWFPIAARLARGPCLELRHAADPERRLARAGQLLDEAWELAHRQPTQWRPVG